MAHRKNSTNLTALTSIYRELEELAEEDPEFAEQLIDMLTEMKPARKLH